MSKFFVLLRNRKSKWLSFGVWLLLPIVLSPLHLAHAYLDPGTGSYIIQVAIGIIFGATYTLKVFSGRIVNYFKNLRSGDKKPKGKNDK